MGPGYGPPTPLPYGWTGYAPYFPEHHHHGHPLAWVLFALLLVVLLLVIANLVVTLMRRRGGPWMRGIGPRGPGGGPEAVLRMRYARGEITRDEFLQASADLAGPGATPG